MTVWVPIVFTLLFVVAAFSVVALALSMRVPMLHQPDIGQMDRSAPKPR